MEPRLFFPAGWFTKASRGGAACLMPFPARRTTLYFTTTAAAHHRRGARQVLAELDFFSTKMTYIAVGVIFVLSPIPGNIAGAW